MIVIDNFGQKIYVCDDDDHVWDGGDDDHVEDGGSIIDGSAEPLILNIRNGHCHRYRRSTHKKPFSPIWIRKSVDRLF